MMSRQETKQQKTEYTDEEINELAEWVESLTLKQTFWLKESFEAYMKMRAINEESLHVH